MNFYVYQITNMINGKTYIGAHKTSDPNDGYLGSGLVIRRAVHKYGPKNFTKTILCQCTSEQEMYIQEALLVTSEFVAREDTYNMKVGGIGGWSNVDWTGKVQSPEHKQKRGIFAPKTKEYREKISLAQKGTKKPWSAISTPERRKKQSLAAIAYLQKHPDARKGSNNPAFGKKRPDLAERNKQRSFSFRQEIYTPVLREEKVVSGQ